MLINRAVKPKPKEKVDFTTPKINYGNVENIEYYHIEKNNFPIINLISLIASGVAIGINSIKISSRSIKITYVIISLAFNVILTSIFVYNMYGNYYL